MKEMNKLSDDEDKDKDKDKDKDDDTKKEEVKKEKEVEKIKRKMLHKTRSIFLRNLAPSITKQEVEAVSNMSSSTRKQHYGLCVMYRPKSACALHTG